MHDVASAGKKRGRRPIGLRRYKRKACKTQSLEEEAARTILMYRCYLERVEIFLRAPVLRNPVHELPVLCNPRRNTMAMGAQLIIIIILRIKILRESKHR